MPSSRAISPTLYTFGSMSLGADPARIEDDIAVARRAMEAGVWFHSSPTYSRGFAFAVLRMAFDEARSQTPRIIIKIRDGSPRLMRFETEDACRRLGLEGIDVAQFVAMDRQPGCLVDQLVDGGPVADELARLRDRGLIRQAVLFLDRRNADAAVKAWKASKLVDGVTFYWNAWQRDCTDSAWTAIQTGNVPVLALRTLAGGPEDTRTAAIRAGVQALAEAAGCADAVEFALRLAASVPAIRTTIGGTARRAHLEHYLACAASARPLPDDILNALDTLRAGPPA